ncbi:MAG: DUF4595 domain-containing protein [Muribaculum sp.]|nr:DUF4595 domain-containing protein [Muribaculaceae bacterium]MCM1080422.1 DUF4595 domain-containing protein [Muribaculum sp.]
MKKFSMLTLLICGAMSFGMSACGNDDDEDEPGNGGYSGVVGNPTAVMPSGAPSSVGSTSISLNEKGQVVKVENGDDTIEFEYGNFSRATTYQVKMTCTDAEEHNVTVFYIKLNSSGYASKVLEVYSDGYTDTWEFKYNAADQLNYMKRSEDDEVTNITYTDGDITSVSVKDEDNDKPEVHKISYSESPISNKGGVMLFDLMFNIDMDEMGVAYYAGLLGKPTKHLPFRLTYDRGYTTFSWDLNNDGLPTILTSTDTEYGYNYTEKIYFVW